MSALRLIVVAGLAGPLGCSSGHKAATTPSAPVPAVDAVPSLPGTLRGERPVRPTRVDQSRTHLNATYATAWGFELGTRAASPTPHYAVALAPTCRTSADCGGGDLSCRAREDGVRVCMGLGSPGESCWFGSDCVSGSCVVDGDRRACH
jgi:hypothetical protein